MSRQKEEVDTTCLIILLFFSSQRLLHLVEVHRGRGFLDVFPVSSSLTPTHGISTRARDQHLSKSNVLRDKRQGSPLFLFVIHFSFCSSSSLSLVT